MANGMAHGVSIFHADILGSDYPFRTIDSDKIAQDDPQAKLQKSPPSLSWSETMSRQANRI